MVNVWILMHWVIKNSCTLGCTFWRQTWCHKTAKKIQIMTDGIKPDSGNIWFWARQFHFSQLWDDVIEFEWHQNQKLPIVVCFGGMFSLIWNMGYLHVQSFLQALRHALLSPYWYRLKLSDHDLLLPYLSSLAEEQHSYGPQLGIAMSLDTSLFCEALSASGFLPHSELKMRYSSGGPFMDIEIISWFWGLQLNSAWLHSVKSNLSLPAYNEAA